MTVSSTLEVMKTMVMTMPPPRHRHLGSRMPGPNLVNRASDVDPRRDEYCILLLLLLLLHCVLLPAFSKRGQRRRCILPPLFLDGRCLPDGTTVPSPTLLRSIQRSEQGRGVFCVSNMIHEAVIIMLFVLHSQILCQIHIFSNLADSGIYTHL
jgi:hypothetical protein